MNLRLPALLLTAGAMAIAMPARATAQRWSDERSSIDTTFAFSASGTLVIDAPGANVTVTGWNRNDARLVVTSPAPVDIAVSAQRIELDADSRTRNARYQVWVPVGTSVSIDVLSGSVNVSGTRAGVSIESLSAGVDVSDVAGTVEIESTTGNINVQRARGSLDIATIGGAVNVTEVEGELRIESTGGNARIERANNVRLAFESVGGSLDFSGTIGGERASQLATHSGGITLRVPSDFRATLELETHRGELNSDFPVTLRGAGNRGRNRDDYVRVPINGGGVTIQIETFNGRVNIRRLGSSTQR